MTITVIKGVTALLDIPFGGTTGQVLAKSSNESFDTEWITISSGGGSPASPSGSIQYNNSGAFGGTANATLDALGNITTVNSNTNRIITGTGTPDNISGTYVRTGSTYNGANTYTNGTYFVFRDGPFTNDIWIASSAVGTTSPSYLTRFDFENTPYCDFQANSLETGFFISYVQAGNIFVDQTSTIQGGAVITSTFANLNNSFNVSAAGDIYGNSISVGQNGGANAGFDANGNIFADNNVLTTNASTTSVTINGTDDSSGYNFQVLGTAEVTGNLSLAFGSLVFQGFGPSSLMVLTNGLLVENMSGGASLTGYNNNWTIYDNGQFGVGLNTPQYALDIYDYNSTGIDIGNSSTGNWHIADDGSMSLLAGNATIDSINGLHIEADFNNLFLAFGLFKNGVDSGLEIYDDNLFEERANIKASDGSFLLSSGNITGDGTGQLTVASMINNGIYRDVSTSFGTIGQLLSSQGSGGTLWVDTPTPLTTLGDIIYENATPAPTRLAGNTTTTKKFLVQTGTGSASAAPSWGTIAATDLPNPSASTLGGIRSLAAVTHQWINTISTSGVPSATQPAFSDISGTLATSQLLVTSADLTGQSAAVSSVVSVTSPNDGNKHTYRVGAYTTITAVATDVLNTEVTYTDETGTARTQLFYPMGLTSASLAATGAYSFPCTNIRVNPNTAITVKTVLTTSIGTITYDVGGTIEQLT